MLRLQQCVGPELINPQKRKVVVGDAVASAAAG